MISQRRVEETKFHTHKIWFLDGLQWMAECMENGRFLRQDKTRQDKITVVGCGGVK